MTKAASLIPALALSAALAVPLDAQASCVRLRGPRLLEAEVVSCEDPKALAEEKARETSGRGMQADPARLLAARPAKVLSLRIVRFQQLSNDPRAGEKVTAEPWAAAEKPKEAARYLFVTDETCEEIKPGSTRRFLEEFDCCDMIPPQTLACLLGLPVVVEPP